MKYIYVYKMLYQTWILMKPLMTSLTDFIGEILLSKTTTYAAKQLGVEKVIKHQRNGALAILQGRDVFVAKPTGSEKIIDLPNDFLGSRLHKSSFFER